MNLKSERDLSSDFSKKVFGKADSPDTIYQNYVKQLAKHHFTVKNIIQVIINKKYSVNIAARVSFFLALSLIVTIVSYGGSALYML